MTDIEAQWLAHMKQTLAVELGRLQSAGIPPKAQVERLFQIPEVEQAFEIRARAVRKQGKWTLPVNCTVDTVIPELDEARRLVFDWEQGCAKNEMPDWLLLQLARLWGIGPAERAEGDS